MVNNKNGKRQVRNGRPQAPKGKGANGGNGRSRVPLLPTGVNNSATMPPSTYEYTLCGEEVIRTISINNTNVGQVVFNDLISPQIVLRLRIIAGAFQRIDWKKASIHLVALNGSLVTSGYTMGFIEDPEVTVPNVSSAVIPFLTALRKTTVRQAWVESESGVQVAMADKPEMFTQLGSDVRRWSPGRVVIATTGDVGTAPTTFMVMLKYHVRLFVPMGIESQAGEIGVLNAFADVTTTATALTSTPWFTGTVTVGQTRKLESDMLCVEGGGNNSRRLRIVVAGTLVTLQDSGGAFAVTFATQPPGEQWLIAQWKNDGPVEPLTSAVNNSVYGFSGNLI